jgi:hypothetical protein
MRRILSVCITLLGLMLSAQAQDASFCKLPSTLTHLKDVAAEASDITLDANMLKLAINAMNKDKANEADVQKMMSSIKGICVRSYKFDKGVEQYSEQDVDALRSQFNDSTWSSMVKVRNKRESESVDVLFHTENGIFSGIVVIAAKPEKFTFVRIEGSIDLSQLAKLGGQFGIPKLNMLGQPKPAPKPEPKPESK